jgi:hypothetical protein
MSAQGSTTVPSPPTLPTPVIKRKVDALSIPEEDTSTAAATPSKKGKTETEADTENKSPPPSATTSPRYDHFLCLHALLLFPHLFVSLLICWINPIPSDCLWVDLLEPWSPPRPHPPCPSDAPSLPCMWSATQARSSTSRCHLYCYVYLHVLITPPIPILPSSPNCVSAQDMPIIVPDLKACSAELKVCATASYSANLYSLIVKPSWKLLQVYSYHIVTLLTLLCPPGHTVCLCGCVRRARGLLLQ